MKRILIIFFLIANSFFSVAQDTIKVYPVRMAINKKSKYKADTIYFLGQKIINKETYATLSLPENWFLSKPHPIFIKYFLSDLKLYEEYLVYCECKCGVYRLYSRDDGKLQVEGQYSPMFRKKGYCGKKIGIWKYYNAKGEVINIENFDEETKH